MCSRHLLSFRDERRRLLRERIPNTRCEDAGATRKGAPNPAKRNVRAFHPPYIPLFQRNASRTRKTIHHARLHQPPHQAFCRYRSKCDSFSSARNRGNHAAMIQVVDFRESTVSNSSTSAKNPAMRLNKRKTRTIGALERTGRSIRASAKNHLLETDPGRRNSNRTRRPSTKGAACKAAPNVATSRRRRHPRASAQASSSCARESGR